ncbi:hypothetical protein [Halorubrum distributum]|uniref:Uncharacterized protein n=1 Tax=Halorubrum distributum TaxID=29283 RepID=A0A6B1IMX6_9EURY|nr:hypothetical protein [Halorubrum terrestre]MYL68620.1 hypothetical protein [Halorubrum terrestre]
MRRRGFLVGTGITLATVGSGCLGDTPPDASATVEIESVTINDDPEDKATVTVNDDHATLEGVFGADMNCVTLETATFTSSKGEVIVELTTEATGDDCDGPATVAYTGEITANFTINDLLLNHVHEENDRTTVSSYERGN